MKTDGSWPFVHEEEGLPVTVRYSWTSGAKLRPIEGTASRGDWDGKTFKWRLEAAIVVLCLGLTFRLFPVARVPTGLDRCIRTCGWRRLVGSSPRETLLFLSGISLRQLSKTQSENDKLGCRCYLGFCMFAEILLSSFTNVREFPDVSIEYGTVPLPVALAVAMHKWQWKQEGLGWE